MGRILVLFVALAALFPKSALAYPWMVHHGYTGCAECHVDPSGAGTLTDYGRAQSEIFLRTHWTKDGPKEPEATSSFGFGAFELPKPLKLQADLRSIFIPIPNDPRFILMQADLRAAIYTKKFSASASLGAVSDGAQGAWLSSNPDGFNLVAREYWAGYSPTKGLQIRAGRMNLPFGIRTEDHILYVRSATNTNINDDQQVGLSVGFSRKKIRTELMGIAGNFQVAPDDFRKRGYAGYFAYAITRDLEVGVSSMFTRSGLDVETLSPRTQMAHGLMVRGAPVKALAIMAEADVLIDNDDGERSLGVVATTVLDLEPTQGVHVMGIGDFCSRDLGGGEPVYRAGGAVQWFFATRMDLRVDGGYGVLSCSPGSDPNPYGLLQAHFFL
jgi:hypothetical protein